jgi:hypothetical protein
LPRKHLKKIFLEMRNNLYGLPVAVLLLCVGIAGCSHQTRSVSDNPVQWDSIRTETIYHLLGDTENPNCNLQIKLLFPAGFDNREVPDAVRQYIVRSFFGEPYASLSPREAAERYAADYLNDYKELEKDFLEEREHRHGHDRDHDHDAPPASWFSYYEFFSNEIVYSKNNLLCYAVCCENYTGGAHGSHSRTCHILDLSTGQPVTEEDFFADGYQEKLAAILVDKIARQNRVSNAGELEDMGFFSIDEIYPNGNFTISDDGITYYFNEYEIAPYVVGITAVSIPYGEIKHLLRNSDSRIALLTGQ